MKVKVKMTINIIAFRKSGSFLSLRSFLKIVLLFKKLKTDSC